MSLQISQKLPSQPLDKHLTHFHWPPVHVSFRITEEKRVHDTTLLYRPSCSTHKPRPNQHHSCGTSVTITRSELLTGYVYIGSSIKIHPEPEVWSTITSFFSEKNLMVADSSSCFFFLLVLKFELFYFSYTPWNPLF